MHQWTVNDRYGNTIYITEERWEHILEGHEELTGHLDDQLDTLRYDQRRQEALEPQKYRYRRAYNDLIYGYNHIIAVVVFHFDDTGVSNNFVTSAWGAYIYAKG